VDTKIAEFGLHAKIGSKEINAVDIQVFDDGGHLELASGEAAR